MLELVLCHEKNEDFQGKIKIKSKDYNRLAVVCRKLVCVAVHRKLVRLCAASPCIWPCCSVLQAHAAVPQGLAPDLVAMPCDSRKALWPYLAALSLRLVELTAYLASALRKMPSQQA